VLPTLVLDTECYVNYYLVAFRAVETDRVVAFEAHDERALDIADRAKIKQILAGYKVVTFNGKGYDAVVMALALRGGNTRALKALSDAVIVGKLKPWDVEREYHLPQLEFDHIDLMEVAPGQGNLKTYAARMHSKRLQDLPIAPNAVLTPDEKAATRDYCINSDCVATIDLYNKLRPQIELREQMSAEYGVDLRSKSDAQVAEAVIKEMITRRAGFVPKKPHVPAGSVFRYTPPDWLQYRSQALRDILATAAAADFVVDDTGYVIMPPALDELAVPIGAGVYRMGMGGLHSSEQCVAHVADEDTLLIDRDVRSYYPEIILGEGLEPAHLRGHFLPVYRTIVQRRLAAKDAGNKVVADSLKITINGSFGKLGNKYSALYSPDLMIQVTLTGQLALLMLIEAFDAIGIEVVQANTDGIVSKLPKHLYDDMLRVISWWELATGFETEETRYRALYSRDVNTYLAIKDGKGGTKTKGPLSPTGLQKNPDNVICTEAVCAFLEHGTPIAKTVYECDDVRKFITVRAVKGGGVIGGTRVLLPPPLTPTGRVSKKAGKFSHHEGATYLGKTVRWVRSMFSDQDIRYLASGNKVPDSDCCMPLMTLPDEVPFELDREWYVTESYKILRDIGVAC